MWWPGLSTEINKLVTSCQVCCEQKRTQQKELLITTLLPERPWKRIAMDLCESKYDSYLAFARFGIPNEVVSDNAPQFSNAEFKELQDS